MSLWTPARQPMAAPGRLERAAIALLRGVGGEVEWWFYSRHARIGHLRVAVTAAEHEAMPRGCAVNDAGEAGRPRRRTR